jgi:hypothetical protein
MPFTGTDEFHAAMAAWNSGDDTARAWLNSVVAGWVRPHLPAEMRRQTPDVPDLADEIAMTVTAGISPHLEAQALRLADFTTAGSGAGQ